MPVEVGQLPQMKWVVFNAAIGNAEDCGKFLLLGSTPVHFCQMEKRARFSDCAREDGNLDFLANFMSSR